MAANAFSNGILEFQVGVPVVVRLKFADGKQITTKRGPRVLYTLTDGRVMFLDPETARDLEHLELKPAQPVQITKLRERGIDRWEVWPAATEPAGHGELHVPVVGAVTSPHANVESRPEVNKVNSSDPSIHQGWAQHVLAITNALCQVYTAAARSHPEIPSDAVAGFVSAAYGNLRNGANVA